CGLPLYSIALPVDLIAWFLEFSLYVIPRSRECLGLAEVPFSDPAGHLVNVLFDSFTQCELFDGNRRQRTRVRASGHTRHIESN
ncbi:MAG TPA: hypothetical protein VFV34_25890, partial [Blastocatellia bacterium]|nr:hypothetical protein [Blastocatellia bacterium]